MSTPQPPFGGTTAAPSDLFDTTTLLSLGLVVVLLGSAYTLGQQLLAAATPRSLRICFVWNAFNALIHFVFEGSYLYNCFFTYADIDVDASDSSLAPGAFLNRPDRTYGSAYGDNPLAQLWQVYARADARWGGADANVISLELLTVFGGGALAVLVCALIVRRDPMVGFWMTVLATAELYGGWMTFCPEWLTGSANLDTSNFMYLYVYLAFFNLLWVAFPLYEIKVAYDDMVNAFRIRNGVITQSLLLAKKESEKAL